MALGRLLLVALIVRGVYNLWWIGLNVTPVSDALDYHLMAIQLLETGTITHLGRPPLFPALLAGVYGLFGPDPLAGRLFLSVIDTMTCGVIFLIGREMFGNRVGLWAAWASTGYIMLFQWTGSLLTEVPFTFFLCLFIWLAQRGLRTHSRVDFLVAGLFLGLATLTRPTTLMFLPFIPVWAWLAFPGRWRLVLVPSALIVGIAVLTLAPWTIRNYAATTHFIPVTVMGGQVMLGANNPRVLDEFAGGWIPPLRSGLITQADTVGRSPVERDALYQRKAMAFITANPLYFARLCVYKFKLFWHLNRASDPASLQYLLVAAFAAVGTVLNRRRWREIGLLYFLPFFFTLSALIFWGDDRIRSPLEPVLLIFAATAWTWTADAVKSRWAREN